jgi:inosose dehydratase
MSEERKIKIGISPIGWTNDDIPDELGGDIPFEQCIDEMAFAGYEGCEVGVKFPRDPKILKRALDLRHLSIASAWFGCYLTTKPLQETIDRFIRHRDFLYEMGARVIVVAEEGIFDREASQVPLSHRPIFSASDWKKLVEGLHTLGKIAAEKNMRIVYHHHMGTGVQTFEETVKLMEMTDPNLVSLLVDTGHMTLAGGDPLELIKRFPDRVKHLHFKDVRKNIMELAIEKDMSFLDAVKLGIFTVPGDGMIDFIPIIKELEKINYEGWIIVEAEQDPQKAPPLEYAIKARTYLSQMANA